jgi:UDP-glucose 4-epimerase
MRCLVTGGAGFIGSHLVDKLIDIGYQVTIIDNLYTGSPANVNSAANFVQGDIRDTDLVQKLMREVDVCFHLAAITSVMVSNQEWSMSNEVNLGGTIKIFEASRKLARSIPIIYASSAAVYGNNQNMPLRESELPAPINFYGLDKYASELHASVSASIYNIPSVGLRFFNVYGPRQDPSSPYSGVISIFVDKAKTKQNITIFGDGSQSRDFIHVSDVVDHLITAWKFVLSEQKASVLNVCTGHATSINELAQLVAQVSGNQTLLEYLPARTCDIKHSLGDPSLAISKLHITATTPLAVGLRELF